MSNITITFTQPQLQELIESVDNKVDFLSDVVTDAIWVDPENRYITVEGLKLIRTTVEKQIDELIAVIRLQEKLKSYLPDELDL
jgi:hypothetical protein